MAPAPLTWESLKNIDLKATPVRGGDALRRRGQNAPIRDVSTLK